MWEKDRCDGKRKLKYNAVPVISSSVPHNVSVPQDILMPQDIFVSQDVSVLQDVSVPQDVSMPQDVPVPQDVPILSENYNKNNNVVNMLIASMTNEGNVKINYQYQLHSDNIKQLNDKQPEDLLSMLTNVQEEIDWKKQCQELKQLLAKSKSKCEQLQDTMKKREELFNKIIRKSYLYKIRSEKRLKKLRQENQTYNKLRSRLGEVFNEDQIRVLTNPKMNCREWSDETVKRAIQLRRACGSVGYQQILEQHIPFPCERTLRRKIHNVELDKDTEHITTEEAIDFLDNNEELY
ncbi:PREDICTED: uncharacterized protein LOC108748899 isoform X2 [Trachymyrmex septentrionalis]|nr:PREDICTED: uncharacterized protein LOC108748899 isoform X2 [Trachymyrmex septentrionalis]